jgi:hypothetical protein
MFSRSAETKRHSVHDKIQYRRVYDTWTIVDAALNQMPALVSVEIEFASVKCLQSAWQDT